MVKARLRRAGAGRSPRNHFTVGIDDDVTHTSLAVRPDVRHRAATTSSARCSTAWAPTARSAPTRTRSRSSARRPDRYAQGYFVYDSKKSGAQTVSHLRFGPRPIHAPYLIAPAELRRLPPVRLPRAASTCWRTPRRRDFLLNSPYGAGRGLGPPAALGPGADHRQAAALLRHRRATRVAARAGHGRRGSTRSCRPASSRISGVLPRDEAIAQIKHAIEKTYGKQGRGGRAQELRRGRRRPGAPARGARARRGVEQPRVRPPTRARPTRRRSCSR